MRCIRCEGCKRPLSNMEIALNLKLRGRSASRFGCLSCLAQRLGCTQETLEEMAAFYRGQGCELFAREYVCEHEGGDGP